MSAEKYPRIFSNQMKAIVYIFSGQMEAIVYSFDKTHEVMQKKSRYSNSRYS